MQMRARFTRLILASSVSALVGLTNSSALAGNFVWGGASNPWSINGAWSSGTAPAGTNPADILNFGGNTALPYTATNNVAAVPFLVNRINLTSAGGIGTFHTISGNALAFSGVDPALVQDGAGGMTFNTPFQIDATMTVSGSGAGLATANAKISGIAKLVKNGTCTFRFGTTFVAPVVGPSANTWLGDIVINAGTVRFNNNEQSGRTAVRANPVFLNGVSSVFSCNSEMRFGALSGAFGDVKTTISTADTFNPASESIVITALTDGSYAGALTLSPPMGTGNHNGELIVRGTGTQTFTGTISIDEDVIVGRGATLVLSDAASLGSQLIGSVILGGGTIRLENESTNNNNRIRNAIGDPAGTSTTLQPVGGGTFVLGGNAGGTQELTGRLQLGAFSVTESKPRAGHMNLEVIHRAAAAGDTSLTFQNYSRDQQTLNQFATVNFLSTDDSQVPQHLLLGQAGNAPHIYLTSGTFAVPLRSPSARSHRTRFPIVSWIQPPSGPGMK